MLAMAHFRLCFHQSERRASSQRFQVQGERWSLEDRSKKCPRCPRLIHFRSLESSQAARASVPPRLLSFYCLVGALSGDLTLLLLQSNVTLMVWRGPSNRNLRHYFPLSSLLRGLHFQSAHVFGQSKEGYGLLSGRNNFCRWANDDLILSSSESEFT